MATTPGSTERRSGLIANRLRRTRRSTTLPDQLIELVAAAAAGTPPPVDFQTVLLPRPPGPVSAVLGFTGHHVVAADIDPSWLDTTRDPADFGSVMRGPFLAALGAQVGAKVGHLDVVLVAPSDAGRRSEAPRAAIELIRVDPRTDDHARVRRALDYRRDVRAHRTQDGAGVVMLGRGLADRWEISFEVDPNARGHGLGTALASAGPRLAPRGERVFAQVSPGNVASLRVLLGAGYQPIGSEVLLLHPNDQPASRKARRKATGVVPRHRLK